MKTLTNLILVVAVQASLNHSTLAADAVTYIADPMPAFTTNDNFLFSTSGQVELPRFDTLGGALVLRKAVITLQYAGEITYQVTNNGSTTGFGSLKVIFGTTASCPLGTMWSPPFGSSSGGPSIPPGQTLPCIAHGSHSHIKTYLSPAVDLSGAGNFTIDANVTLPVENVNPAQFSAVYASGFPTPPEVSITYTYKCTGDVNEDHVVNIDDLVVVINWWGFHGFCNTPDNWGCPADVAPANPNGLVNIDDLVQLITHWGDCPVGP
jgi:hypothetical protein